MKSANWISGTGFRPYIAIPMAAPMIPASASGVSITRSGPNSSIKPSVARKTPPNLPTSSPSTTTRGSRRISMRSASFTAWMMFHCAKPTSAISRARVYPTAGVLGSPSGGQDAGLPRLRRAVDPALDKELAGLVAGADQRPRRDEAEAQGKAFALQVGERLGTHELDHLEVLLGRAQVLAQGEDVAPDRAQVAHRLHDFGAGLAQAEHQAALGAHAAALVSREHLERLAIAGAAVAHARGGPRPRREVVRGHRGVGVDDHVQREGAALEVRREHLAQRARRSSAQLDDRLGEVRGAPVLQLVAVHARDDQVVEPEPAHRLGEVARFERIERLRRAAAHVAEAAAAGADVAHQHHGGCAAAP